MAIDDSKFKLQVKRLRGTIQDRANVAVNNVADEVLRLSQREVPHRDGYLQTSGHVEPLGELAAIVGYNKVYAARLHEHPEYNFQKNRKGKYLEDPIKRNLRILKQFIINSVKF